MKTQILREGTHAAAENTREMDIPTLFFFDRNSVITLVNGVHGSGLTLDPFFHLIFQDRQRKGTVVKKGIVKCAYVKRLAEHFFRTGPQLPDSELSHFVCQRLPG